MDKRASLLAQLVEAPGNVKIITIEPGIEVEVREPRFALSAGFADDFEEADVNENDERFEYQSDLDRMAAVVMDTAFVPGEGVPLFTEKSQLHQIKASIVGQLFMESMALVNAPVEQVETVATEGKVQGDGDAPKTLAAG